MPRSASRFAVAATAVILWFLIPAAGAAEPIRGTLDATPQGEVTIGVVRGQVTIIGVDGSQVRVEGVRDSASERFVFERAGDTITIEDVLPRRTVRGDGTRLTVHLPRGSRVRVQLVSADLDVQEVQGKARLATVSGDISARALGGDVEVNTVSGRVNLDGASGDVRLQTVSGRVTGDLSASRLSVQTISGDVSVTNRQPLGRGRLTSVSGDLTLASPLQPDADVELETVSGDADLALAGPLDLRLDLTGGPGGRIRNQLTDEPARNRGPGLGQQLDLRIGDGRGYLRAATISGTVTVGADR